MFDCTKERMSVSVGLLVGNLISARMNEWACGCVGVGAYWYDIQTSSKLTSLSRTFKSDASSSNCQSCPPTPTPPHPIPPR